MEVIQNEVVRRVSVSSIAWLDLCMLQHPDVLPRLVMEIHVLAPVAKRHGIETMYDLTGRWLSRLKSDVPSAIRRGFNISVCGERRIIPAVQRVTKVTATTLRPVMVNKGPRPLKQVLAL